MAIDNEKNNDSIIYFCYVVAAGLGAYIASTLLDLAGGMFGPIARLRDLTIVRHGFPFSIFLVTFLYLFFEKRIYAWTDECVTEIKRVVWPSRKDVAQMTTVVCVMVLLSGLTLGIWDFLSSQLMKMFVN